MTTVQMNKMGTFKITEDLNNLFSQSNVYYNTLMADMVELLPYDVSLWFSEKTIYDVVKVSLEHSGFLNNVYLYLSLRYDMDDIVKTISTSLGQLNDALLMPVQVKVDMINEEDLYSILKINKIITIMVLIKTLTPLHLPNN